MGQEIWHTLTLHLYPRLSAMNSAALTLLSFSMTVTSRSLETKSPRLSRPAETQLRYTGPAFSLRLSRDRTSETSSLAFQDPPSQVVPPLLLSPQPAVMQKLLTRKKRNPQRKKRRKRTWTWVAFSAMTTEENQVLTKEEPSILENYL